MAQRPGMASYYDVLGVEVDAPADEVKRAYHRRAQLLHPDRFAAAPEAELRRVEAEMKAVNEAWQTLKNPAARRRYDVSLGLVESGYPVELWDEDEGYERRTPLLRRPGVRVAVVALIVAGFVGSAVAAVVSGGGDPGPERPETWTPAAEAELRMAAVRAGFTSTQAECFVRYITSRYSPDDQIDVTTVDEAAGACR